ncbi:unnamed protein product [Allacma fusca]|uniref:Uncharacterized protein n=1 Tax=Allacma fusca TaxID=39272 RepID=A0A8J2LDS8_9HEXA|nr:unnamed protein product [Allacma fusca]
MPRISYKEPNCLLAQNALKIHMFQCAPSDQIALAFSNTRCIPNDNVCYGIGDPCLIRLKNIHDVPRDRGIVGLVRCGRNTCRMFKVNVTALKVNAFQNPRTIVKADGGSAFQIRSSDGVVITIRLKQPISEPLSGLVEVYGTGQGKNLILAESFTTFAEEVAAKFDMPTYNEFELLLSLKTFIFPSRREDMFVFLLKMTQETNLDSHDVTCLFVL